jgi:hypothetical protein
MTTERDAMDLMVCPKTRTVQHPEGIRCAGSVCMHWRWDAVQDKRQASGDMRTGFCGPAGSNQ